MTRRPPPLPQPAPGLRGAVERRSAPVLLWLSSRPAFLLPALVVVLLVAGLAAPAAAGVPLLLLLGALLVWLTYLSWPALEPAARVLRLAMLALVLVTVVQRVVSA